MDWEIQERIGFGILGLPLPASVFLRDGHIIRTCGFGGVGVSEIGSILGFPKPPSKATTDENGLYGILTITIFYRYFFRISMEKNLPSSERKTELHNQSSQQRECQMSPTQTSYNHRNHEGNIKT